MPTPMIGRDSTLVAGHFSLPTPQTMHAMLASRAATLGDRSAYTFQANRGDVTITFAQLDRRARTVAAALQQSVTVGDRVLLLFPAGLEFIYSFFGCLYAGALAVPTMYPKPRRPMPRLNSIARDCTAKVVLTDHDTLQTVDRSVPELQSLEWVAVDTIDDAGEGSYRHLDVDSEAIAFLQYTSGSTSEPKGVMVSHGNLLHNLETIRHGFGLDFCDGAGPPQTGVFWLPAYHDMGLIGGILESLYVGGHSVLMSPAAFLQRPLGWLEAISAYKAHISGAPNFAYELAVNRSTDEQRQGLDLSSWKLAFCGAEPIRAETLEHFAEAFSVSGFRHDSFYPCFGLAEGTLLAAGNVGPHAISTLSVQRTALKRHQVLPADPTGDGDDVQRLVACGNALLDQEIQIIDPESRRPQTNAVGEIWIKGPSVAQGYWQRPDETVATFQASIAGTGQGPFLRTGDLGFITDGQLYITGRLKDMMIIRGRNYYPQDIEKTVGDAHEALRQDGGAVFSLPCNGQEQVIVVHEVDRQYREGNFEEIIRAIRREVARQHELDVYSVVLIRHASLPRTTSGKAQRHLCREYYTTGEFKILAQWSRAGLQDDTDNADVAIASATEDAPARMARPDHQLTPDEIARLSERVESWLLNWLVERAAIPTNEIHRDKPFAEYGLDSMTAVELSLELEDWLGVEVVPTVAWNYPTPASLSRYLALARAGVDDPAENTAGPELDNQFEQLLNEIEGMSPEEAARVLQLEQSSSASISQDRQAT